MSRRGAPITIRHRTEQWPSKIIIRESRSEEDMQEIYTNIEAPESLYVSVLMLPYNIGDSSRTERNMSQKSTGLKDHGLTDPV